MKRYYVCKIIGDGQTPETAFRAAIQDIIDPRTGMRAFNTAAVIATGADGKPILPWCLVIAAAQDHTLALGNTDIDPMPDFALDVKLSAMHAATKNAMMTRLQARGIDTSLFSNSDGFRDVIRSLGQRHHQSFSEDAFDVSE